MNLTQFLKYNAPGNKPELWKNLPKSLFRHGLYHWIKKTRPDALGELLPVTYDHDLKLEVTLNDAIGRSIYLYGCYEYGITQFVKFFLEKGMAFGDVGANIGYYTLLAAKRVGPTGSVYAIEALDPLYRRLERNVERNQFTQVKTYPYAISGHTGVVDFCAVDADDNSGLSSERPRLPSDLQKEYPGATMHTVQVPAMTLNQFVDDNQIRRLDLLKVDVEGTELQVLEGAENIWRSETPPDLIFEYNWDDSI